MNLTKAAPVRMHTVVFLSVMFIIFCGGAYHALRREAADLTPGHVLSILILPALLLGFILLEVRNWRRGRQEGQRKACGDVGGSDDWRNE